MATPDPATVNQSLTYTLIVTNTGAAAANNVRVSDILPGGVTYVSGGTSVNGVSVTNNNGTLTANLGSVAAGAIDTITLVVTPTQTGTIQNTATVSTSTVNASTHTSATATTTVNPVVNAQANLSIFKAATPNPGTVNQSETYVLVVVNTGAVPANNVNVTDTLPAGVTYVSASTNVNGVSVTNNNGTLTADLGTVAAGAVETVTIIVTPTQAGTLTNTASVSTTTPNSSTHTTASINTTINPVNNNQANLSITKTAAPSPGTVGQSLTYTIVVTDAAGAADAAGVVVTDTLPNTGIDAQVTATDTTRNVSLTVNNGVITDNIGTITAGTSDTITVTVTPTQAGILTNTASVTTSTSNSSNQTSATIQTTVNPLSTHFCYLNGQPGDGSDQTFITNLYRELLGRDPDSQGLQGWLSLLQQNSGNAAAERQHIIQAFLHSEEYEAHWVACAFDEFLGRPVDKGGQKHFVDAMNAGLSMQTVLVFIMSSPEYLAHHGHTNAAFVQAVFQDLLGRAASQTDQQALANALDRGQLTRGQVVQFVLTSPEAAHKLLDAPGSAPGVPGTPATGSYPLAVVTGGGWDNLYFQGRLSSLNSSAVDQLMGKLESGMSWQTVEQNMLTLPEYFGAI